MKTHVPSKGTSNNFSDTKESNKELALLSLGALGVVFGDIGTSPLYSFKECFSGAFSISVTELNILGILSLIFWALIVVVTIKYVFFLMRADNDGEGGIFALLEMLRRKTNSSGYWISLIALVGASLLYADGIITPSISVLSAMEGLSIATDELTPFILPGTVTILSTLFIIQRKGTSTLGSFFGPILLIWMLTLATVGTKEIVMHPHVLLALNPNYAIRFFIENQWHGFATLGAVVLCVTGGEALYADMGHFGTKPIRYAWLYVCLPSLVLNYFGQGALLLSHPEMVSNPFYGLIPKTMLIPMVGLSTAATVIASQAMITGVYSLTRQAIQLGFLPRMNIIYTNAATRGQIYIPNVNWLMMLGCLMLVFCFRSSGNLAGAYGIAVTATMGMTSVLYFRVATHIWKWNVLKVGLLVSLFLFFDLSFFCANSLKIASGGWVTMMIAAIIIWLMLSWNTGSRELAVFYKGMSCSISAFLDQIRSSQILRVPGTAIFLGGIRNSAPVALLQHIRHNKALHNTVVILGIHTQESPFVNDEHRLDVSPLGEGVIQVVAHYGFMETPNVPQIIELLHANNTHIDFDDISFYLGRITLNNTGESGMSSWKRHIFVSMTRNAWDAAHYFNIPANQIVEIGMQINI